MKASRRTGYLSVAILLAVSLAACDKPGPAESAGRNIDRSIDQVGEKMNQQGQKMGVAMDDSEITAKVKAAIFAEPGLKSLQISVDTVNGVVTLSGSVNSKESSATAVSLAQAISGVKGVDNRLQYK